MELKLYNVSNVKSATTNRWIVNIKRYAIIVMDVIMIKYINYVRINSRLILVWMKITIQ